LAQTKNATSPCNIANLPQNKSAKDYFDKNKDIQLGLAVRDKPERVTVLKKGCTLRARKRAEVLGQKEKSQQKVSH
jgi:hypothetical protein